MDNSKIDKFSEIDIKGLNQDFKIAYEKALVEHEKFISKQTVKIEEYDKIESAIEFSNLIAELFN